MKVMNNNYIGKYPVFKGSKVFIETIKWLKSLSKEEMPPLLVYGDPDIDGLISLRNLKTFLESELNLKSVPYYCNSNRAHGFMLDLNSIERGTIIFAVDFAITREEIKNIVDSGFDIISIDHHDVEDEFIYYMGEDNYGVVINNQYPFEDSEWSFQSGAGVLWHILNAYYEGDRTKFIDNYEDLDYGFQDEAKALVGLTLLSDVRNIEMPNSREFLKCLYLCTMGGYIGYLLNETKGNDYNFGIPKFDRNFADFTFSPKVNALFRFNLEYLAIDFILEKGYPDIDYQKLQKEFLDKLIEDVEVFEFSSTIFVKIYTDGLSSVELNYVENFIGLLASKFTDTGKCVIAYIERPDGSAGRASFRSSIQTLPFRSSLLEYIDGRGHQGAFGIIGFRGDMRNFSKINRTIKELTRGYQEAIDFIEVSNLSVYVKSSRMAREIANENMYRLPQNRLYIKYTGSVDNIVKKRGSSKYALYEINGIKVVCFDLKLNPKEDLILPMLDKGWETYQLAKSFKN